MFAKDILKAKGSGVESVAPDDLVAAVARAFKDKRIGFAIVAGDGPGGFIGTVSERDIMHGIAQHGGDVAGMPVESVMTREVVTCTPDVTLPKIMSLMTTRRTRHVLVMDGKSLMGVISIGDAIKLRLEESLLDEESLREYIAGKLY